MAYLGEIPQSSVDSTHNPLYNIYKIRSKEKPKMTKQEATQNIKNYKDITAYFDGTFSLEDFQNMMRYRFGFGEAETMVISSALVKVGAFAK